jgi:hypothetical protein
MTDEEFEAMKPETIKWEPAETVNPDELPTYGELYGPPYPAPQSNRQRITADIWIEAFLALAISATAVCVIVWKYF